MEIKAQLKFLHLAPRKVREVVNVVRGLSVEEAENQLLLLKKRPGQPILKLLKSAIANAKDSYSLNKNDLKIKRIEVSEGPTLDRWFPRAFGRAAPIRKRSSHLLIILEPQKSITAIKKKDTAKPQEPKEELKIESSVEPVKKEKDISKREGKEKETQKGPQLKKKDTFIKKIFRRKTI